jgi:hypothetical protein
MLLLASKECFLTSQGLVGAGMDCNALHWWFSPCTPVSTTNKTDRHDITEILLKVALNTIKQTNGCHWEGYICHSKLWVFLWP